MAEKHENHYKCWYCEKMVKGDDPEYVVLDDDTDYNTICPACLSERSHLFDSCYKLSSEQPDYPSTSCSDTDYDEEDEEKLSKQIEKHDNHREKIYGECAVECEMKEDADGCKRICAGISMRGDTDADRGGALCMSCADYSRFSDDRYYWLLPFDKEKFTVLHLPPFKKNKKELR